MLRKLFILNHPNNKKWNKKHIFLGFHLLFNKSNDFLDFFKKVSLFPRVLELDFELEIKKPVEIQHYPINLNIFTISF